MQPEYYYAAAYLRLSKEDHNGNVIESNSIKLQRELVYSFVQKQTDIEIYDIYIDDGYSGTDFQRPEFKRMIEDLSLKKVNCIIVKDLSRFGRDYIEVGRWIQKTLPAFGARFIAITDRYDSKTATKSENFFLLPIKNFMNDSYCQDISQKVRSHQRIKREKGEFIGAFSVYGYNKSQKNRNHLEKDPYAARIVRKIYEWRLAGSSMLAIAERLNQAGILSPMEYKRLNGEDYYTGFCTNVCSRWSAASVKRILENEIYTGTLVQGKKERVSYKVKKSLPKKKEEWIRVFDCHEAIITREEYDIVQKLLQVPVRAGKNTGRSHLFTGLLFCADCGKPLIRRINRYKGKEKVFYICSTKNKGLGCSRHSIEESILQGYICKIIKCFSDNIVCRTNQGVLESVWKHNCGAEQELSKKIWEKELKKLKEYRESYQKLCFSLNTDLAEGILTKEEADSLFQIYKEQEKGIGEAITKQQANSELKDFREEDFRWRRQELFLIDRIEVEEGGSVWITLNNGKRCRLPEKENILLEFMQDFL